MFRGITLELSLKPFKKTDREYIEGVCTKLQRINTILESANAHIGYRVRDEIVFYMLNNKKAELLKDYGRKHVLLQVSTSGCCYRLCHIRF